MKANRCFVGLHLLLVGIACQAQLAAAEEAQPQFKYSNEWSLVSAPPPAGPYQPVNIDPRVPGPGPGIIPPRMPMAMPAPRAIQEPAAEGRYEAGSAGYMAGQTALDDQAGGVTPEEPAIMPPVPGHYQPVMPQAAANYAAEPAAGDAVTARQEQAARKPTVMEPEEQAAPEMAAGEASGTEEALTAGQAPAAESLQAMEPEEQVTATAPVAAGTATEQPGVEAAPATVSAGSASESPMASQEEVPAMAPEAGGVAAEAAAMEQAPRATTEAAAEMMPPPRQDTGMPSAISRMPEVTGIEEPATAMQEQPVFQAPAPDYYERMPPPAAGRITQEPPAGPAARLRERPARPYPGYPGYGYYGRTMPSTPAYSYPETPRYPYQSGMPGYRNMPAYGYPEGQEWQEEEVVPPPPVYDSWRYPGEQGRVPR